MCVKPAQLKALINMLHVYGLHRRFLCPNTLNTKHGVFFPTDRPVSKAHLLILMWIKMANSMEFLESQRLVKAPLNTRHKRTV